MPASKAMISEFLVGVLLTVGFGLREQGKVGGSAPAQFGELKFLTVHERSFSSRSDDNSDVGFIRR